MRPAKKRDGKIFYYEERAQQTRVSSSFLNAAYSELVFEEMYRVFGLFRKYMSASFVRKSSINSAGNKTSTRSTGVGGGGAGGSDDPDDGSGGGGDRYHEVNFGYGKERVQISRNRAADATGVLKTEEWLYLMRTEHPELKDELKEKQERRRRRTGGGEYASVPKPENSIGSENRAEALHREERLDPHPE